jgi:hypothetical protein
VTCPPEALLEAKKKGTQLFFPDEKELRPLFGLNC